MNELNSYVKVYGNGLKSKTVCSHTLRYLDETFLPTTFQHGGGGKRGSKGNVKTSSNQKRATQSFYDIALNNEWCSFITLTFDPNKVNSFDKDEVYSQFRKWVFIHLNRKGYNYLAMPERHKSGAIHFHLLSNRPITTMLESGHYTKTKDGLKSVYNLPDWKYGFSTGIELYGDIDITINYCLKYVTKQTESIYNHYYFAGGKTLERRPIKAYHYENFENADGKVFDCPANHNIKFKYMLYK